ncbi:transporter substrate-binding domain-containing protein [Sinosporangium siamense]|uniref:ABC transporter substrate-binding protein n=1 Tax=Sinosporangium siamense TaxID=1367973 RepID=A0A919V6P5_9ACTN|nr:transporter substrate-binding domain-containing protein [Sinosporangium siamense]GII91217.1 ABC transporter substrate-binding protein [Sinosporangium siamense]
MPAKVRRHVSLLAAALLLLSACTTPSTPASPPGKKAATAAFTKGNRVTIGVLTDQPGMGYLEVGGNKRDGFDLGLANWLAAELGFETRFVDLTIGERMSALTEEPHLTQAVLASFSITDDRRESIDFAGPYLVNKKGVMTLADNKEIKSIADLEGKTICTMGGSTSLQELDLRNLHVSVEDGITQCIDNLKKKSVDAVSADQLILYGSAAQDKKVQVVDDLSFGHFEYYGIGLPNNSFTDCQTLTGKIRDFIRSGSWETFFRQNFPGIPSNAFKPKPESLFTCENPSSDADNPPKGP